MLKIQENISFKDLTTMKLGGPAKFLVEVQSEEELIEALEYAKENNLPYFILGGGCNILASEEGFPGLVIKMKNSNHNISTECMACSAGLPLAKAVSLATQNELTGLEWAAGIPGTVGGAVRGNAGAFGKDMSTIVDSVKVADYQDLKIKTLNALECEFGYRESVFKKNRNLIVLEATLKLARGNKEEIQNQVNERNLRRISMQPQGVSSPGSFFINPTVDKQALIQEYEKETGVTARDGKIAAGWLIDKADLKGKQVGGAKISEKHANFLINAGGATAEDVAMLGSIIKRKVRDEFGVQLVEEVELVGFE